jgi:hypothetical protein
MGMMRDSRVFTPTPPPGFALKMSAEGALQWIEEPPWESRSPWQ